MPLPFAGLVVSSHGRMNFDKLPEENEAPAPKVSPGKLRLWVWLVVGALAVAGVWLVREQKKQESTDTDRAARLEQIRGKELRLAELGADIARSGGDRATQLRLTEAGLGLVEEIARLRPRPEPKDSTRIFEWQARRDEARAALTSVESRQWEEESERKLRDGDRVAAIDLVKRAWKLQREINASAASQAYKNYGRETRLAGEAERLEAEPLGAQVALALAEAERSVAGNDWIGALDAYRRARDAQAQLNRDYPRSRYADIEGATRIGREISALEASGPMQELEQALARARAAGADGAAALRSWKVALELQQRINREHAQSRFASAERLVEIEREIETLEAAAAWEELGALDRRIAAHLAKRELFQAQELAAQAARLLEKSATRWPKAQGAPEELRLRLTFLALRAADLAAVQDQVYGLLRPLPGRERGAMLVRETPQGLFASVMNFNPSKAPGKESPVDSVTRGEAEEFCRRLGWMLGRRVRLPDADEMIPVFNAEASGPRTWQAVQGGLGEWVRGNMQGRDPWYITEVKPDGSFALQEMPATERLRGVGFRFVVEQDNSTP